MWPSSLRQTLKSRYENSSNYANALTKPKRSIRDTSEGGLGTLDRTYCSNKTNRVAGTGAIRPGPTTMDRNTTTIEPTDNGFILAVTDTNTNHTHENRKLPNKPKHKKYKRLGLERQSVGPIHNTPKVQRSMEGYIQRTPTTVGAPAQPEEGAAHKREGR